MSVGEDCRIKIFAKNIAGMNQEKVFRVISDHVSSTVVVDADGNKVSET